MNVEAFVFIDTNALLHYQFFDEVDWPAQFGVTNVTLVFAPIVLAELDRHKWSGSRHERARKASRALRVADCVLPVQLGCRRPFIYRER